MASRYSLLLLTILLRFGDILTLSSLHRRDPRASSSLFDSYGGDSRPASRSPSNVGGYGYGGYPGAGAGTDRPMNGNGSGGGYRSATPNAKFVLPSTVAESCVLPRTPAWSQMDGANEAG
jgi:uncharacterized membrane protein